jgi:hypothetical protein
VSGANDGNIYYFEQLQDGTFAPEHTTRRNATKYNTTQRNAAQHNTTQYKLNTTQHNSKQHNATQLVPETLSATSMLGLISQHN